MARPIRAAAIGDSITKGVISNPVGTGPGSVEDGDNCWCGKLEDFCVANRDFEFLRNCGVSGSNMAAWLPGSSDRLNVGQPTHARQPPGPIPDGPLWDWGVASQLPLDLVFVTGELNQMSGIDGYRPGCKPAQVGGTLAVLVDALFAVGVNCVVVSSHGLPDIRFAGLRNIPPGNTGINWLRYAAAQMMGAQWTDGRVQKGVDASVEYSQFPQTAFYGDAAINAQDVHPNQFGHDQFYEKLRIRVDQIPRYLMQPDEAGT